MPMGRIYTATGRSKIVDLSKGLKKSKKSTGLKKKSFSTVGSTGRQKKAKRLARQIQLHLGEKKYGESTGSQSVDFSGAIIDVSAIAQGDGDTNRNGDQLTLTSYELKYNWVQADTTNLVRTIIFQWLPNTSAGAPTVGSVLIAAPLGTATAPLAVYDHDNRYNFRILYDKLHRLDAAHVIQGNEIMITKFARNRIQFNGGATTGSNRIYILIISDSAAAAHPTFYYDNKINFRDS